MGTALAASTLLALAVPLILALAMSLFSRKNHFPVAGKTVLLTGGSQGTGKEAARQLAAKGAHVAIVARSADKLAGAVEYIREGAASPGTQRFTYISADLSQAGECARVLDECAAWNGGAPPDVVWCCAGSAQPTLFADTAPEKLDAQMKTNYFSGAYIAHAALQHWLGRRGAGGASAGEQGSGEQDATGNDASNDAPQDARHIIFTSSFLALFAFAGYAPYSPCKAALRSLHETLSMELELYNAAPAGAFPGGRKPPAVRVHTLFPASIYTEGFAAEQALKSDLAKKLEEGDEGQTPAEVARRAIRGLEQGREFIDTALVTSLVRASVLGGDARRGAGALFDTLLSWITAAFAVMVFVRRDMDAKVRRWGSEHGVSGMKAPGKGALEK